MGILPHHLILIAMDFASSFGGLKKNKAISNVRTTPEESKRDTLKNQCNRVFTKLFDSYHCVLQKLLKDNLMTLMNIRPLLDKNPYPSRYDTQFFFQYH